MTPQPIRDEDGDTIAYFDRDPVTGETIKYSLDGTPEDVWDYNAGGWAEEVRLQRGYEIIAEGIEREQTRLGGRKLTHAELEAPLRRCGAKLDAGEVPDFQEEFSACVRDGETRVLNPSASRDDSVEFQMRRRADEEAVANGWRIGEPLPPRKAGYNWHNREDRVDRALDRMEGRRSAEDAEDVTGDGWNPADTEWEGEWDGQEVAG